ncbi:hypothetical protein DY000_02038365 [Brassica cretica]|uniref:Uncharacterized protein n=1 Tax=Brassica cretica TaxID=69181 RepID=A0ABQ7BQE3_BRACR|nr:hypothetical protein DY000_02038365 [Brassica cretica]
MKTERRRMNQRTWTMLALELEGRRSEQRPSMSFSCCFADHSPPLFLHTTVYIPIFSVSRPIRD